MAFNNAATRAPAQSNDQWKAKGFLNLYLPSADGKRRKLGAIALKDSKPNEAKMLDWLNEDPSRVSKILAKLEIEYQAAEQNAGAAFALED